MDFPSDFSAASKALDRRLEKSAVVLVASTKGNLLALMSQLKDIPIF